MGMSSLKSFRDHDEPRTSILRTILVILDVVIPLGLLTSKQLTSYVAVGNPLVTYYENFVLPSLKMKVPPTLNWMLKR
jgi:hypothetical protein